MMPDENDDEIPGKEVSVLAKPAKQQQKIKALPDVIAGHMEEDKDLIIISEEIDPHQRSSTYGKPCWKPPSPFSNVHFRNTTKILQHRFFTLNFLLILL